MSYEILVGEVLDRLRALPDESVHCVVTSPPYYGLRDYGVEGQIGLEATPAEFLAKLVAVFREVRRVLRKDGTCWVNMGDSYNQNQGAGFDTNRNGGARKAAAACPRVFTGLPPKNLMGMPWRLAFALQDDGWWLRQDIIWSKPNPMPESVTDRCTKAHEYLFLLTKSSQYFYDADAIREPVTSIDKRAGRNSSCLVDKSPEPRKGMRSSDPERFGLSRGNTNESCSHPLGRNKRSVWEIATEAFPEAHFATFPRKLVEPCIMAGSPADGTVLDPFNGSGTTGLVAIKHGRNYIGIELNPDYAAMAERRLSEASKQFGLFSPVAQQMEEVRHEVVI